MTVVPHATGVATMTEASKTAPPQPCGDAPAAELLRESPPLHDARVLTNTHGEARISLDSKIYVLRITRAGKLILTK